MRTILDSGNREGGFQLIYSLLEQIMAEMKAAKAPQFTIILDAAELSFWKVAHLESKQRNICTNTNTCQDYLLVITFSDELLFRM